MRRAGILSTVFALAACGSSTIEPEGPAPIPAAEHAATMAAMQPPKRLRPVIAVIGQNEGTETTDFLVPYAVLAAADAAEVIAVAPEAGIIRLTPALTIEAQSTTSGFDARYPEGADYVIVPKIQDAADPEVVAWIQAQAATGAIIVGICSGVKTVAAAGFLEGRRATGHWFDIEELRKAHPTMEWVRDRRYVVDREVVTTTGVSASLPISLALVEAIAGSGRARKVARELGVSTWDARHDSAAFYLDDTSRRAAERNQTLGVTDLFAVPVSPGVDDVALAFLADAWSRTYRSKAFAVTAQDQPITTRRGLTLRPDAPRARMFDAPTLPVSDRVLPAQILPESLAGIADRYQADTASFVALQLEYAWHPGQGE